MAIKSSSLLWSEQAIEVFKKDLQLPYSRKKHYLFPWEKSSVVPSSLATENGRP